MEVPIPCHYENNLRLHEPLSSSARGDSRERHAVADNARTPTEPAPPVHIVLPRASLFGASRRYWRTAVMGGGWRVLQRLSLYGRRR
jgi:hypothetical protein